MKKILGISIVAMLAVTPLAASADVATVGTNDATVGVASTKYVKEAYNAMAGAVNTELATKQNTIDSSHKLSSDLVDDTGHTNKFVTASEKETWNAKQNAITDSAKLSAGLVDDSSSTNKFVTESEKSTWNAKQNALTAGDGIDITSDTIKVDLNDNSGLAFDATNKKLELSSATKTSLGKADSAVQSVTTGTEQMANGTISVDGTAVAVKGLGSAAYAATTDFDAAGTAAAVEGKLDDGANGYDIDAKTLKVQGVDAATISGTQTLTNKTIDADNNTIQDLATGNFKSGVIVTTVGTTGADTSIATEKAVRDAINSATSSATTDMATQTGVVATINQAKVQIYNGWASGGTPTDAATISVSVPSDKYYTGLTGDTGTAKTVVAPSNP